MLLRSQSIYMMNFQASRGRSDNRVGAALINHLFAGPARSIA